MLFIVVGFPIVSSGLFIWLRGLQITWENRTVRNIATSGWNSYAQIHNTVSYMREAPNALAKIIDAFSGSGKSKSSSKKESNAAIAALILVVLAALSGYFTASAIMKKADKEYDAYSIARKRAEG